jgi:GT2 family glycosyltransferase
MTSIIICSINDTRFASVSRNLSALLKYHHHEIIRIPDAKSLAEGYTRGIAQSHGQSIILCHDDIEILSPDFAMRLYQHLKQFDVIGVAGTNRLIRAEWVAAGPPHIFGQVGQVHPSGGYAVCIFGVPGRAAPGMQAMDGLFLAAHRSVFDKISFDAKTFDGFHHYDLDFTFAAHLAGLRTAVACDINILHYSQGSQDEKWKHYARLFHQKYAAHFHPMSPRKFALSWVYIRTKPEAQEIMSAPFQQ